MGCSMHSLNQEICLCMCKLRDRGFVRIYLDSPTYLDLKAANVLVEAGVSTIFGSLKKSRALMWTSSGRALNMRTSANGAQNIETATGM